MSGIKTEKNKKFNPININNFYQGVSNKSSKTSVIRHVGLQPLGKVGINRRLPAQSLQQEQEPQQQQPQRQQQHEPSQEPQQVQQQQQSEQQKQMTTRLAATQKPILTDKDLESSEDMSKQTKWASGRITIDYDAKLNFSDDEEESHQPPRRQQPQLQQPQHKSQQTPSSQQQQPPPQSQQHQLPVANGACEDIKVADVCDSVTEPRPSQPPRRDQSPIRGRHNNIHQQGRHRDHNMRPRNGPPHHVPHVPRRWQGPRPPVSNPQVTAHQEPLQRQANLLPPAQRSDGLRDHSQRALDHNGPTSGSPHQKQQHKDQLEHRSFQRHPDAEAPKLDDGHVNNDCPSQPTPNQSSMQNAASHNSHNQLPPRLAAAQKPILTDKDLESSDDISKQTKWASGRITIDYDAKLNFSDDEEEPQPQQKSQQQPRPHQQPRPQQQPKPHQPQNEPQVQQTQQQLQQQQPLSQPQQVQQPKSLEQPRQPQPLEQPRQPQLLEQPRTPQPLEQARQPPPNKPQQQPQILQQPQQKQPEANGACKEIKVADSDSVDSRPSQPSRRDQSPIRGRHNNIHQQGRHRDHNMRPRNGPSHHVPHVTRRWQGQKPAVTNSANMNHQELPNRHNNHYPELNSNHNNQNNHFSHRPPPAPRFMRDVHYLNDSPPLSISNHNNQIRQPQQQPQQQQQLQQQLQHHHDQQANNKPTTVIRSRVFYRSDIKRVSGRKPGDYSSTKN